MTRLGLACCVGLLALGTIGCGDDDDGDGSSASEDGGNSGGKPIVLPGKDKDAGDSENTVTLGDAGARVADCGDAKDGDACGPNGGLVCLDGSCVASRCGDGFVDPALEECDDENTVASDGCSPECAWDCKDDSMCDDDATCNGQERCLVNHTCATDDPEPDGTACTSATISDGQCRQGNCIPAGCGDEDVKGSEQCDDGNAVAGDGCELDCTFSCEQDGDCDDGSICSGTERCDVATHVCKAGEELRCSDDDDCTTDACDPEMGCAFTLIDSDGDNHAPDTLACGDDCDDTRPDVYPGHPELCDEIDHDCVPDSGNDTVPSWYQDCDGDGYAGLDAESMQTCDMPVATQACPWWTTRKPVREDVLSYDCNDAEVSAYPGQTGWFTAYAEGTSSWEYNCTTMVEKRFPTTGVGTGAYCTSLGVIGKPGTSTCIGASGWVAASPLCGKPGQYTRCTTIITRDGTSCLRTYFDETQECH